MSKKISEAISDVINIFVRENADNDCVMNIVLEVLNDLSAQYIHKAKTGWEIKSLFEMYEKLACSLEENDKSVIEMYMKDNIAEKLFNNLRSAISIVTGELDCESVAGVILSSYMHYVEMLHEDFDYFKKYVSPDKEVNEYLKNNDMVSFAQREVYLRLSLIRKFNFIENLDQENLN